MGFTQRVFVNLQGVIMAQKKMKMKKSKFSNEGKKRKNHKKNQLSVKKNRKRRKPKNKNSTSIDVSKETFIFPKIKDPKLQYKVPVALYDELKKMVRNKNTRYGIYFILYTVWNEPFRKLIMVHEYIRNYKEGHEKDEKIRFSGNTASQIRKYLEYAGLIKLIKKGSYKDKEASVYEVIKAKIRDIYINNEGFYESFEDAEKGNVTKFREYAGEYTLGDVELEDYLRNNHFYLHRANVFDFIDNYKGKERKDVAWRKVKNLQSGYQVPIWTMDNDVDRIYSKEPCLQNIPKMLRLPYLFSKDNKDFYEIDFASQFFNLYTLENYGKTFDNIWDKLEAKTGLSKSEIKGVIVPKILGQTANNYKRRQYHNGLHADEADAIRKKVLRALALYGIWIEGNNFNFFQKTSKLFKDVLREMSRANIELILALHDGVVIQGNREDADKVAENFQRMSKKHFKKIMPVKITMIASSADSKQDTEEVQFLA